MSLPTKTELKLVLKIQSSAEDTLLDALIARATARVRAHIRRPITAELREFVLDAPSQSITRGVSVLHVPIYPVAAEDTATEALTLTDNDGDELVAGTDYRLDRRTGKITALDGGAFTVWPYTIEATVGLSAFDEYASDIEPVIGAAILDDASQLYHQRNPAATNETTGGGVSASYESGISQRVKDMLAPWVMARALG